MAYGFNLGQIEGLDSTVKTVTLMIANATESNTYTLNKVSEDPLVWSDSPDSESATGYIMLTDGVAGLYIVAFTESDVGDTYNITISTSAVEENFKSAVETVLADNGLINESETLFDGTITITAEDARGVEIPFDKDVSSYPFEKWTVTINELEIPYIVDADRFVLADDNMGYTVFDNDGVYMFNVVSIPDTSHPPVPGDYQVKIVAQVESGGGGSSGLPDVSASDNGSVLGVVNGEWGVDDRLKDYPSISNRSGKVLGFGLSRDEERIAQAIIPAPMSMTSYKNNAFYLPFKDSNRVEPEYCAVEVETRVTSQSDAAISFLVDDGVNFRFESTLLNLAATGTYTLKATINNGLISFQWVKDT